MLQNKKMRCETHTARKPEQLRDPACEAWPEAHARQAVAPVVAIYVFVGQKRQAVRPDCAENEAAGQSTHAWAVAYFPAVHADGASVQFAERLEPDALIVPVGPTHGVNTVTAERAYMK